MKGIKFTGHPFVDVGVAVMECWLDKKCKEFTDEDLMKAKKWLIKQYDKASFKGYLSTIFPNSFWANYNISEEKKEVRRKELLEEEKVIGRKCYFCDNQATFLANRAYIPLIAGEDSLNYSTFGLFDIPVCKYCITSIQFFPLGSIKVEGSILIFWSTSNEWTLKLTKSIFEIMQQITTGLKGNEKIEGFKKPKTRLMEILDRSLKDIKKENVKNINDFTAYHFTNYGTSPDIDMYSLPAKLSRYLTLIKRSEFSEIHNNIKIYHWLIPKKKNKEQEEKVDYDNIQNKYWEALCDVFQSENWKEESYRIVKYFYLIKDKEKIYLNCFGLAEFFLKEVNGMRKERLDIVRILGDLIAEIGKKDTKWINNLYNRELKPYEFINYLTRLQKYLSGIEKVFKYEDILLLLDISNEEDSTINYQESSLIQSLILIRVFEVLSKNKEIIAQIKEEGE